VYAFILTRPSFWFCWGREGCFSGQIFNVRRSNLGWILKKLCVRGLYWNDWLMTPVNFRVTSTNARYSKVLITVADVLGALAVRFLCEVVPCILWFIRRSVLILSQHALTLKLTFMRSLTVIISYHLLLVITVCIIIHKVHLL
jgi:hypothetical protein